MHVCILCIFTLRDYLRIFMQQKNERRNKMIRLDKECYARMKFKTMTEKKSTEIENQNKRMK